MVSTLVQIHFSSLLEALTCWPISCHCTIYSHSSFSCRHLPCPPPFHPPSLPLLLPLLLHLVPGDSRSKSGKHYPGRRRGLGAHGGGARDEGTDTRHGSLGPRGRVLGRGKGRWSRGSRSTTASAESSTSKIKANYIVNSVSLCYTKRYKRYTYNPQRQVMCTLPHSQLPFSQVLAQPHGPEPSIMPAKYDSPPYADFRDGHARLDLLNITFLD